MAHHSFHLGIHDYPGFLECEFACHHVAATLADRTKIYARRLLILLELIGGVCHILFFFCFIIPLIMLAPRSSNEFVWETSVNNVSGWSNPGLAFCIGLLSPTFVLTGKFPLPRFESRLLTSKGFDGVIHMSDEVKDAPLRIPRSMIYTVVINAVFCWAFTIVILYTIGDYNTVLNSPTGLPIIQLVYQATKSRAATNTLVSFILIIYTVGNFSIIASVSRLIWAFARDKGLPYSDYFAYVSTQCSTE
jgi:choline transport protein